MNHKTVFLRVGAAVLILEVLAVFYVKYNLYKKRRQKYLATVKQLEAKAKFNTHAFTPVTQSTDLLPDKGMSDANIKQLQKAYRHPFEFISPKLYTEDEQLPTEDDIFFVQDENAYREQVRQYSQVIA